ncbi:thermonuclease family protein [Synechocystis sp. PCC 7509]|uniref:thermonuclease family protein n=1 Tax=Synechocystis sp. PCC 7509 TaxID=927677 RepID=UPI00048C3D96|nr:thermonuclease family protein [Synechocystis sp. PCC 7509]
MKNLLIKISLVFPLLFSPSLALAQNAPATVISIGDGDTLRVRQSGQVTTIRLACVDAPERSQSPWGQQSTSKLKQLLPPGTPVQVRTITRDRYGRTVAELYVGKQSVNLQMVKDGQAVVYRQYLSGCAATKDQYLQAEVQAKKQRLGFWNQKSPVMPWDYRRGKRSSNPQINKVASSTRTQSLPNCTNSDCNCSDFQTQVQAQQVLKAFPGDKFRLDSDSDGVACESLP